MSELAVKLSGPTLETAGANAGRACVVIEVTDAGTPMVVDDVVRELKRLDTIRSYRVLVTVAGGAALAAALRASGWPGQATCRDRIPTARRAAGCRSGDHAPGIAAPATATSRAARSDRWPPASR